MIYLVYIGMAQALFASFFFINRRPLRTSDWIVSLLMLLLAAPLISIILSMNIMHGPAGPAIAAARQCTLTYGPLLYLYTRTMVEEHPSIRPHDMLHLAPFLLLLAASFSFAPRPAPGIPGEGPLAAVSVSANILSFISYTVLAIILLRRHDRKISEYFSFRSSRITLHWLQWTAASFALAFIFVFAASFLAPRIPLFQYPDPVPALESIGMVFFIFTFNFFALSQPVIYAEEDTGAGTDETPADRRYEKSGLKDEDAENYLKKLESYMSEEKPYMDGDLTILDVSEHLDIPRHYLTQIINEKLNKNFYMYINEYRIEEAKKKMNDKLYSEHTILRIAYDSGFNSKSAFNSIFKKTTGFSPSDYRKKFL
ncbi:MAG: AraC family transcriptional regulator [Spirochaetes bacterium]|jgi:AraC-like DNA-binding protein|nr:AraC family transcriptional regulator [Spirochaetota bacterium]